jgi:ABC-type sugar transport system permease subunit
MENMKKSIKKFFVACGHGLQKVFGIYENGAEYVVKGIDVIAKPIGKGIVKVGDGIGKITPKWFKQRYHDSTMAQKKAFTGYMFLLPWIIGFFGLVVYPFGRIIYMSLNNVSLYQQDFTYEWIGLGNFKRILLEDIDFVIEVQNFIVRVLLYSPVIITLAIIVAMLLNQNIKGKGLFRMIFFLPIIILNGELLENMANYGGMDISLSFFVIDVIETLVPEFAADLFVGLFEIIVEILWYTGVPILIFLAMLQKIDRSLYEAASIDGANSWSMFWKITLPIIRPAITVSIVFIVVFLANFDGNPINQMILSSKNDQARRDGYASAMALIYSFVQVLVITILYFIARERPQKARL